MRKILVTLFLPFPSPASFTCLVVFTSLAFLHFRELENPSDHFSLVIFYQTQVNTSVLLYFFLNGFDAWGNEPFICGVGPLHSHVVT